MSYLTINYKDLFVNRIGENLEAYMITTDLVKIFPINSYIMLKNNNLIQIDTPIIINIPKTLNTKIPEFAIVEGRFSQNINNSYEIINNNILGNNSTFYCKISNIHIPNIPFSEDLLDYFNCKILTEGQSVNIQNKIEMPLFKIKIGKKYKEDYLLKDGLGDGFYIETHDTPHIHQPLNSNVDGYIVLAKKIENILLLSKFKIPFGKAIYIPPNIYHSDSLLIGDYNVLYTKSENYVTYLFKKYDNTIVNII